MDISIYELHENCYDELPIILNKGAKVQTTDTSFRFNWHESIEIIYVDDGSGYVICDFEETQVNRGDIFVINSNVLHAFKTDTHMSFYYLIIDSNFCKTNSVDVFQILFENKICDSRAVAMFETILHTVNNKSDFYVAKVRAKVLDFLVFICETYSKAIDKTENRYNKNFDYIKKSIVYIRDNIGDKITVDTLSQISGMSKYHFIREFKRITHYTPIMYINSVRIETAKKLISGGKLSIKEVCERCGFDNLSYFTKIFKRYTGITPSQMKLEKSNNI